VTFQRNMPRRITFGHYTDYIWATRINLCLWLFWISTTDCTSILSTTDKLDSTDKRGTQRKPLVTELMRLLGHTSQSVFWDELYKMFRELLMCVTVECKRFVFEPWDMWWAVSVGAFVVVTLLANLFIYFTFRRYIL